MSSMPHELSVAPDFTLPDQDGNDHTLSSYEGQYVLLYFYPKDDTPGCTKQACMLRDATPAFEKLDAKVFGISVDTVASHKKFKDKYNLPFDLLADTEKTVVNQYGVWGKKKMMGKEFEGINRTSFLIDPSGLIVRVYENVKPELHAEQVLADLKLLKD